MATSSRASMAGHRRPADGRLPVWGTVRDAFADVLGHSRALTRLALPWLLLSTAVGVAAMAHAALRDAAWTVSQLVAWLGAMAIGVAWTRWRLVGDEPAGIARLSRHVGRVMLRSVLPGLLVILAVTLLLAWSAVVAAGDLASSAIGYGAALLGGLMAIAYVAGFPLFYLYVALGAVGGDATQFRAVLAATRGNRMRLWLACAILIACGLLVPLAGILLGFATLEPLTGPVLLEGGEVSQVIDDVLTLLAEMVGYGMAAVGGAFMAIVWTRLRPPGAQPPG